MICCCYLLQECQRRSAQERECGRAAGPAIPRRASMCCRCFHGRQGRDCTAAAGLGCTLLGRTLLQPDWTHTLRGSLLAIRKLPLQWQVGFITCIRHLGKRTWRSDWMGPFNSLALCPLLLWSGTCTVSCIA